jgi:hypothetical protein
MTEPTRCRHKAAPTQLRLLDQASATAISNRERAAHPMGRPSHRISGIIQRLDLVEVLFKMENLRWQAQFVLWGGLLLFLIANLAGGQLSTVGKTLWGTG